MAGCIGGRDVFYIIVLLFVISCTYVCLSIGCELRNYKSGHMFIRAFQAKTTYQRFFTLLYRQDQIKRRDMKKLTYIGYVGVVLSTAALIIIVIISVYLSFKNNVNVAYILALFEMRGMISSLWGILAMIIQGIDSLLNRFH